MARLILIPGMGGDPRMYDPLATAGCDGRRCAWVPHRPGEDLDGYAMRFAAAHGIADGDALVGTSLGGMVAGAIARMLPSCRVIRISSCTAIGQLAPWLRQLGRLTPVWPFGLPRLVPLRLLPATRRLALAMYRDQDPAFIRWACGAALRWTGAPPRPQDRAIHGSADPVFPPGRQPRIDALIADGGHLLVMERPAEVAAALRRCLA